MGPSGRITHVIGYIGLYCTVWDRICRFCIWVELPYKGDSARFSKVASSNPTSTCIPRVDRYSTDPRVWGVTAWYQSLGIRLPRA